MKPNEKKTHIVQTADTRITSTFADKQDIFGALHTELQTHLLTAIANGRTRFSQNEI